MNSNKPLHSLSGQEVELNLKHEDTTTPKGSKFLVKDWWINIHKVPWNICGGTYYICGEYAYRLGLLNLPYDNEVILGTIDGMEYLIHETEIIYPLIKAQGG